MLDEKTLHSLLKCDISLYASFNLNNERQNQMMPGLETKHEK